ncbi:MAG: DUF2846 domain-containing protein [Gammaproteobacteria bacterium]|nr:DUF2846 domain-containing protein [Gammaproteobacteria bacterium]
MQFFKRCVCLVVALLVTSACATTDSTYLQIVESIPPVPESQGRVFFYRASREPKKIRPEIRVSGQVVGRAVPNCFFYVDRRPGSYSVTSKSDAGQSMSINVRRAGVIYVRVDVKLTQVSWDLLLAIVPEKVALEEMKNTHYQL